MERALFNLLHGASRRHVFLACRRSQDIACVTAQLSYKLCVAARRGRREFHTSSVEASLASRSRMRMRDMVRHGHGENLRSTVAPRFSDAASHLWSVRVYLLFVIVISSG